MKGEFLTVETYNSIKGLPNLHVDALSRKGERYSIKTFTEPSRTTGVFFGCGDNDDKNKPEKKFEYVVLVQISKDYRPKIIIELTWGQFLKFRKWHKTMRAWNLSLTNDLLKEGRTIFKNQKNEIK